MSLGSPRVTVRLPQALLDLVEAELRSQAEHSPLGPETLSDFVQCAIRERIAKRRRSRTRTPAQRERRRQRLLELQWETAERARQRGGSQ